MTGPERPALVVERTGPRATIQDLGRPGYRGRGVPLGGAFDRESHELANALVGNGPDAASIELTLFGGTFRALAPIAVALAGAPMPAIVRRPGGGERRLSPPVAFGLGPGDVLLVEGTPVGARAYLAVRGGWRTRRILGSRSCEEPLGPGAVLSAVAGAAGPVRWPARGLWRPIDASRPIRVVEGPDAARLGVRALAGTEFVVSADSDRMGIRLEGPEIPASAPSDRRSTPVLPGAVQISGGRPIVLGVACGTMGGYPIVALVASADLDRLGQLRPGQAIRFEPIGLDEARRLDRFEREFRERNRLRIAALASGGSLPGGCHR